MGEGPLDKTDSLLAESIEQTDDSELRYNLREARQHLAVLRDQDDANLTDPRNR
ncbi:MAG: hypothetical protein ABEJ08_05785 [Halobacteriaceae archaeon]